MYRQVNTRVSNPEYPADRYPTRIAVLRLRQNLSSTSFPTLGIVIVTSDGEKEDPCFEARGTANCNPKVNHDLSASALSSYFFP